MKDLVLIVISQFIRTHGYSPTVREICKEVGRSPATVWNHLVNLKKEGLIDYEKGKSRTITLKGK